jgi:sulfite exporter TauE/SafE
MISIMESTLAQLSQPQGVLAFFLVGMVTSFHCICMCGPISAIVFQHTCQTLRRHLVLYHGSRLLAYTWLGWLISGMGFQLKQWGLQKVWALMLMALLLLFVFGKVGWIQKWLFRFQNKLLHLTRDASASQKSAVLGFASPLLPCGPLYAALASSSLAPNPFYAGVWMTAFALGTMPLMLLQQYGLIRMSQRLVKLQQPLFYKGLALLVIVFLWWMHF